MKVAVTGARGFVGPHLVAHLESCGDEVVQLDRSGPDSFDVTDADAVRERFTAVQPEVVYHLAALSHVGDSWKSPGTSFRVNAEGTLNVLRACTEIKTPRVVVVLSSEEYGRVDDGNQLITEDTPLRPVTPYGAAKAAADMLSVQAYLGDGLGVIRVRPFGHTGPGQSPQFVVPAFAARIARAERDDVEGDPGRLARRGPRPHRCARRRARLPARGRARRAGRGLQRLLGRRGERAGDRRPAPHPCDPADRARHGPGSGPAG